MPRPHAFGDQPEDGAVLIDHEMRRHFGGGIAHAGERIIGAFHPGIMQDDHIDLRARGPRSEIGRRAIDHAGLATTEYTASTAPKYGAGAVVFRLETWNAGRAPRAW